MSTARSTVMAAVLRVLPIVKPVTPELSVKLDGKVCALAKLLLASNE